MKLSRERKGELSIISSSFLWSIFPVITVLSYNSLSPLVSLLVSTLFSSGIFAFIITQKKLWHEVTNRHALKDILLNTLLIGVGYYTLIFLGLQYTSPGNASIISLTQILFSFLLFHVFRKEHIPKQHVFGAFLMIIGALIVLASSFQAFHIGDILIVVANIIAPIGNLFAQKPANKSQAKQL